MHTANREGKTYVATSTSLVLSAPPSVPVGVVGVQVDHTEGQCFPEPCVRVVIVTYRERLFPTCSQEQWLFVALLGASRDKHWGV